MDEYPEMQGPDAVDSIWEAARLEERVERLEELVHDMFLFMALADGLGVVRLHSCENGTWSIKSFARRMKEIGMRVPGDASEEGGSWPW